MVDENHQVKRLRLQRSKLADFGSFAFASINLDEILTEACKAACYALGQPGIKVKVLEHRPQLDDFLVRAGVNWPEGVVGKATIGADLDSPAGYALVSNGPVVSQDLDREDRFKIPAVLQDVGIESMVNVMISGRDAPFGVFEADGTSPAMFDEEDIDFLQSLSNLIAAAIERTHLREARERYAREQQILVQELGHRAKNLFALIQALANQGRTEGMSAEAFQEHFLGRLHALARAENLMFQASYEAVDLPQVVDVALDPFQGGETEAVSTEGPKVMVPWRSARMLGLALHELATNASKHGALSVAGGTVAVTWDVDRAEEQISLEWTERGGPQYQSPTRRGFGSRLLEQICPAELGGEAELTHHGEGLTYTLRFPTPPG